MVDAGHLETEKILRDMEKEIAKEYKQAEKEVQEKLEKYIRSFTGKNERKLKLVDEGKLSQKEYEEWLYGQMAMGDRWNNLKNVLAEDYTNASQIAKSISFGHMPEVYAVNRNYGTFQVENACGIDTSYTLYDRDSVEHLFKGGRFYPSPGKKLTEKINAGKALAWNKRQIQSVMTQAILQGESIDKIAKRIAVTVGESDRKSDVRNARTMTTCVQNAGRVDSYKRAQEMGIDLMQEWLATLDGRTRHQHRILDGQRVPVGTPFKVEGDEIEYPGDPAAKGYLIYNCRCTLVPALKGFEVNSKDLSLRNTNHMEEGTYEEWKNEHKRSNMESKEGDEKTSLYSNDLTLDEHRAKFRVGLQNVDNSDVKRVLTEAEKRCDYKRSPDGDTYIEHGHGIKSIMYLGEDASPSAIAHELFHDIDTYYDITKNRALITSLAKDYNRLGNKDIVEYLYENFEHAFEKKGVVKPEYAGISDIIHGCSGGKIHLGYGHFEEDDGTPYWKKNKVEVEAFAQCGRMYYDSNEEVIEMLEAVFPSTAKEFLSIIRRL